MAEHKMSKRECPGCHQEKLFQVRRETCSRECSRLLGAEKKGEKQTFTDDVMDISIPKTRIKTLEELIEHAKVDLTIWEVISFEATKWEVGAKVGSKEHKRLAVTELFQVKAKFKKRVVIAAVMKEIEELKTLNFPKLKINKTQPKFGSHSGNVLEINIPDLHVGKLAWAIETGDENYDVKIAQEVYWVALNTLLSRVQGIQFDKILLIAGNDLLNADNLLHATTRGTVVSTDIRYHRTFAKVRNMMILTLKRLLEIAPVDVIMVPGNHDTLGVWHLGDSLECYFHDEPLIKIDNSPAWRKYYTFGQVMLMFTHGDKGKRNDYPLLMASEQPEMFGRTQFREVHCGHVHQTKLDEQHGIRVRVLPALCAADGWHAENGFVGNLKSAEAYIWNENEGLIGTAIYSKTKEEKRV